MIAGLTEIQAMGLVLLYTLPGVAFGILFGVIARFLGDRYLN